MKMFDNNNNKIISNGEIMPINGWYYIMEPWSYSSATEIIIPAGGADRYSVGQKIRIKQTTYKYFFIVKVEDTKLTVNGGTDYSVANATITENHFSMMKSPLGFPMSKEKWKAEVSDFSCNPLTDNPPTVVLSRDKKYNLEEISLTLGIGEWEIEYIDNPFSNNVSSRTCNVLCGLSNDSITRSGSSTATAIQGFTTSRYVTVGGGYEIFEGLSTPSYRKKIVTLTSSTTYYPWIQAIWYDGDGSLDDPNEIRQGLGNTGVIIRAYLAYL